MSCAEWVDAVTSKILTELLAAVKVPYAVYRCGSSMRATNPSPKVRQFTARSLHTTSPRPAQGHWESKGSRPFNPTD